MDVLAHPAPAGGAPLRDVVVATGVALVALVLLAALAVRHVRGGARPLRRAAEKAAETSGLPVWAALPVAVVGASLLIAVFGFYWDVSTHIDNGRDEGPLANPAHYFILVGLVGIALAGYLSVLLSRGHQLPPTAVRIRGWDVPLGGMLILICGTAAVAGFPLDDVWHRLFGQDVTLWGPTHIQMVAGASLSTLALWVFLTEAVTQGDEKRGRIRTWIVEHRDPIVAGAFLLGLSTLQGEFDFGAPQFRLLYHPVLLMLAASIGLVTARIRCGRGGAIQAALFFLAVRGTLTLLIGPVLGRTTLHFPLYLVEAVLVELVALRIQRPRNLTFGIVSGAAIGTIGLAAEWAWSHVWMPIEWPAELLPEALVVGLLAAVAGGVLGGFTGGALARDPRQGSLPRVAVPVAFAVALVCVAIPAPMDRASPVKARVVLEGLEGPDDELAFVRAMLEPSDAAEGAFWFQGLSWQGRNWDRGSSYVIDVEDLGNGTYRTAEQIPVAGDWKTLLRLHVDDRLMALPVYLPADPAIPAPEVPAPRTFEREFVADKTIVQREAKTTGVGLMRIAYALLAGLGLAWIGTFAWGLSRLEDHHGRQRPSRDPRVGTAASVGT